MKTIALLMAQYDCSAVIPVETVCRDYFGDMLPVVFMRKVLADEIRLPIVRMDDSRRAARGININDLADYLDQRTAAARRECEHLRQAG